MQIGFIGLGNMGRPMAENLVRAGHSGFDTMNVHTEGVETMASAAAAATGADIVIIMLPNGAVLKSVAAQIISDTRPESIFLDYSIIDVQSTRDVSEIANPANVVASDSPVSGGISGASAGILTFMVGGPEKAFQTAKLLFDIMGQKSVHCGESGNRQATKICNNIILGATTAVTCEAFALTDKLGLDRQSMFDVVSSSSGYSWSMNAYCPTPGIWTDFARR